MAHRPPHTFVRLTLRCFIFPPSSQVVKNITKLSEHSQAENTEKSQSTEVDIKVRSRVTAGDGGSSSRGVFCFFNDVSVFCLFFLLLLSGFRQLQLSQNAAARAPPPPPPS